MDTNTVTPLILTYNEEANIGRTLERLAWAERVVVVDSGSTDATLDLLAEHAQVEVFHREFDNHRDQWNYGLGQVDTDWTLTLDADYVLSEAFIEEVRALTPTDNGYLAPFEYCVFGRSLRANLYPQRCVLFRVGEGRYALDGHTQRIDLQGTTGELSAPIYHDDRKPLSAWLGAQERYAQAEVAKYAEASAVQLPFRDRLRTMKLAPPLVLLYTLLGKGLLLDGKAGWYYALQRTYAETLLTLHLLDDELRGGNTPSPR